METITGPTEHEQDEARRVLRRAYWADVRSIVAEAADERRREDMTADETREWIDQTCDGHERIIYTGQAIETLYYSDHTDAYTDKTGEMSADWSVRAYYAFRADVEAQADAEGIYDDPEDEETGEVAS